MTVITGGAGGMGLATAKILGADHLVVISDVKEERLERARLELEQLGIRSEQVVCDIADANAVERLMRRAAGLGDLRSVVHAAGLSPQMADAETIMEVNALGTVNVINACDAVATDGFALVNVASMAAHMIPALLVPKRAYPYAFTDRKVFLKHALLIVRMRPSGWRHPVAAL